MRSALIRSLDGLPLQHKSAEHDWGRIPELCVRRFNERLAQLDRWRNSQIVGFSAERLRLQSRETELNTAIIAISKQDFAMTNFELNPLFFKFLGRYYSEDLIFWLGSEATPGKSAAFERLADILEPLYTLLQLGVAFVDSVIAHPTFQDREGNFVTYWEAVLGGTYGTSIPQN